MTPYSHHNHEMSRMQHEARQAEREMIRLAKLAKQAARDEARRNDESTSHSGVLRRVFGHLSGARAARAARRSETALP